MNCPSCNKSNNTKVVNSRPLNGTIHRRRQCLTCNEKFTTKEYIVGDPDFAAMGEVENILIAIRERAKMALRTTRAIVQGKV